MDFQKGMMDVVSYPLHLRGSAIEAIRTFLRSPQSGRATLEAQAHLIAEMSTLPLRKLDVWEGAIRAELWASAPTPSPRQWALWSKPQRPLSWLDLCNADGFVRERALRCLSAAAPNAFFFILALRRLNDWVPQVREAAREQIPLIAGCSNPEHVVDGLWTVLPRSVDWGRMEPADSRVLIGLLSTEPIATAIGSRILRATTGPAALMLSQIGRIPVLDHRLLEIASSAIQPSVRAKAYRCLFEGRMTWVAGREWVWTDLKWGKRKLDPIIGERPIQVEAAFAEILRKALRDRSPMIRRVAGEFLIKHLDPIGDDAEHFARELASDPSAYVAERGRFALDSLRRNRA